MEFVVEVIIIDFCGYFYYNSWNVLDFFFGNLIFDFLFELFYLIVKHILVPLNVFVKIVFLEKLDVFFELGKVGLPVYVQTFKLVQRIFANYCV